MIFFFQTLAGGSEAERFRALAIQAEALAQAGEYAAAMRIYEGMMELPLEEWQKYRLLYNMGSIQLAQKKPIAALTYFKNIQPTDLSLPRFGSCLYLNEGIAYLYYAQSLATDRYAPFEEQLFFIKESLKAFDEADKLDRALEEKFTPSSSSSPPSFLVDQWRKQAQKQMNKRLELKKQEDLNSDTLKGQAGGAATLLQKGIEVAEEALRLSLSSLTSPQGEKKTKVKSLKDQQGKIAQAVSSFIPTVLKEQEMKFRQTKDLDGRCQRSPWNRVIPLFNLGYRAVEEGENLLRNRARIKTTFLTRQRRFSSELPNLIAAQIQTIRNWKEALELILIPSRHEAAVPELERAREENIHGLQEMYLEDQAKPRQKEQELHSW